MKYFIFNLVDSDRERAVSFINAKRWVVGREERHRDALASGDLVLVFVAATSEFVGRAKLETAFLDPIPVDPAASGPAVSGVLLADTDVWTSGVPFGCRSAAYRSDEFQPLRPGERGRIPFGRGADHRRGVRQSVVAARRGTFYVNSSDTWW